MLLLLQSDSCSAIEASIKDIALCSDEQWRKDARGVLGSLDGLNRSQQRAIATAMSSTFTLWQVLACLLASYQLLCAM